jgi:hypothetical protein
VSSIYNSHLILDLTQSIHEAVHGLYTTNNKRKWTYCEQLAFFLHLPRNELKRTSLSEEIEREGGGNNRVARAPTSPIVLLLAAANGREREGGREN